MPSPRCVTPLLRPRGHPDVWDLQRLCSSGEQDVVDHALVLIGNITDLCWQREHHVIVLHRQQFILSGFEPTFGGTGLTLWTMSIAAGVVSDLHLLATATTQHMATEGGAAAANNR